MTKYRASSDASFVYHEQAGADYAATNSSAVYGNLADAMKNAILITAPILPAEDAIDVEVEVLENAFTRNSSAPTTAATS